MDYYDIRQIIDRERQELSEKAKGCTDQKQRHGYNEAWNALTRVMDQITALGVREGVFDA